MIDIHCHVLPAVDDGPLIKEESIDMCRQAVLNGYSDIIATPHHLNGIYINEKATIIKNVSELNRELQIQNIKLRIHPGQEIRIHNKLLQGLENEELLTLAGSKYVLIEFPTDHIPLYAYELLFRIKKAGYYPIIAHPERNLSIMKDINILERFISQGSLSQITWNSLNGYFGKRSKVIANKIIANKLAHFVASDAHSKTKRSFDSIAVKKQLYSSGFKKIISGYHRNAMVLLQS